MEGEDLPTLGGEEWSDPDEIIKEILETGDELPSWADDGTEVVNYIHEAWPLTEEDLELLEHEAWLEDWDYCDKCEKPLDVQYWVNDSDAEYKEDAEARYIGYVTAYCRNHPEDVFFHYTETWYE